jgi:hypothetical protein
VRTILPNRFPAVERLVRFLNLLSACVCNTSTPNRWVINPNEPASRARAKKQPIEEPSRRSLAHSIAQTAQFKFRAARLVWSRAARLAGQGCRGVTTR